jgi:hypothetical protein
VHGLGLLSNWRIAMFNNETSLDNSIPVIEHYERSYLIDPLDLVQNHGYLNWLKTGLVGHLDLVRWEIKHFTKEDRQRFIEIYRDVLPCGCNPHDGAHPDHRWKRGIFERQTLIRTETMGLCINWKRDYRRQPLKEAGAEIVAHWNKKYDYTAYHAYLRRMEEMMTALGLQWWLSYAELAQDTVSPDVGTYLFKHAILKNGNSDQLMWWDDTARVMKAGTNRRAHNHYQNNGKSIKQLCCHIKTRPDDYFDEELQSFIRRAELRIKKPVIERYGRCIVDTVIENQKMTWNDHLLWRQIHRRQLRTLRMSLKKRKELEEGFVIHAVNQLVQRGISNSEARQKWVLPIERIVCKYLQ